MTQKLYVISKNVMQLMCVHEYLINEKKKHRMFFLELPFLIRHIHF